jgi:hypothetical protein
MSTTADTIAAARRSLASHWMPGSELAIALLDSSGATLAREATDELLAKAVARERVELFVDLLAYEQGAVGADGKRIHNANHVRFRDGLMMSLGRSGVGRPYLRDHQQRSVLAVGGRIVESRSAKIGDGHYQLRQTAQLSEPAAIERVLRGLVPGVSIGWTPDGPVHCTACGTEIYTECYHWPGEVVETKAGAVVVEWEWQAASLLETSEVAVPAVGTAGIDGIRAALAALQSGQAPRRNHHMSTISIAAIAPLLGLAATADEAQVLATVRERTDAARIAEVEARLDANAAGDRFIAAGLAEGRIRPDEDAVWRQLFALSPDRARARLAERAPASATPVGAPSQSAATPAPEPTSPSDAPTGDANVRQLFAKYGVDYDKAARFAEAFGAKDPHAALARHWAGQGVAK